MSRPKVQPPQFIAVTADEYELTLGAFDTVKELAAWSGHKVFAIYQSLEYGRILRKGPAKGCKVLRYTDGHYTAGIPDTNNETACGRYNTHRRRFLCSWIFGNRLPRKRKFFVGQPLAVPRRLVSNFHPDLCARAINQDQHQAIFERRVRFIAATPLRSSTPPHKIVAELLPDAYPPGLLDAVHILGNAGLLPDEPDMAHITETISAVGLHDFCIQPSHQRRPAAADSPSR